MSELKGKWEAKLESIMGSIKSDWLFEQNHDGSWKCQYTLMGNTDVLNELKVEDGYISGEGKIKTPVGTLKFIISGKLDGELLIGEYRTKEMGIKKFSARKSEGK
jgi:hypothetical protein